MGVKKKKKEIYNFGAIAHEVKIDSLLMFPPRQQEQEQQSFFKDL